MPTVSIFYGIIIRMFFDEHAPPHFHAEYGEFKATVGIRELEIRTGSLPDEHKNWCWTGPSSIRPSC
jgi:hypothetical protein